MGHFLELEKAIQAILRENGVNDRMLIEGGHDFDLGLEIALLWIDKLCEHLQEPKTPGGILQSVKSVFRNESLLLLYKTDKAVQVVFSDVPLKKQVEKRLCGPQGFFTKLANIRFTRCLKSDADEIRGLPKECPPIHQVLAVPLFLGGVPSGCLAMVSLTPEARFSTTHAMVLSLAASILSLAKTFDELRDKLMLRE